MVEPTTLEERLAARGISRRTFLKYCATLASALALPPGASRLMAQTLGQSKRPALIWLSFQECTGCTESLTRAFTPTVEDLIFQMISLDYHETLMAAAGHAAEAARKESMEQNWGNYVLAVDGSVATRDGGLYSTVAGQTNLATLKEMLPGAGAVVCVGTCASYGGIPAAAPNPTGAVPVSAVMAEVAPDTPLVNIPGCPPIPVAISAVVAHYVTFNRVPELDSLHRPRSFYGQNIHDRCARRPFYERGKFADSFDDEGARKGWCLFELGCKGPITYNACATVQWNEATSWPIGSGHPCLGCSEPGFWDRGSFYSPLSHAKWGQPWELAAAAGVGGAVGLVSLGINRAGQKRAYRQHEEDLDREVKARNAQVEPPHGGPAGEPAAQGEPAPHEAPHDEPSGDKP